MSTVFAELWRTPAMRDELVELLDVLRERGYAATDAIDPYGIVPIHSHASYGRYEVLAAHGLVSNGAIRESREGPIWSDAHQSDLFFVTLNKSEEDYTPTTRYQDYPVSPTLFHWESQSRTTRASPTGERYANHVARGSRVILFVRENNDDDRGVSNPFVCLGPARHISSKSDKPIQIIWELERPMPAEIYSYSKVAAG